MSGDASNQSSAAEPSGTSFPATRWTLVGRAGSEPVGGTRPALSTLLGRYLPALRSHLVTRQRIRADEADELIQGFVAAKVLEQNLLHRADAARGKFRSFLLVALDRYVIDERRRRAAANRASSAMALAHDEGGPAPGESPSHSFDRAWARELLDEAIRRTRADCDRCGRPELWGVFEGRVLRPALEGAEPLGYEALVSRYGLRSPAQASNVVITAKRMFARHLRAAVGEYADTPAEIDAELRDLWQALRADSSPARRPPDLGT